MRLACVLVAAIGCARPTQVAPPDDTASLVAAMHRYDELVRAMDGRAIAGLFAADGKLANAGQVIATGPVEIAAFLASFDGKVRVEATGSTVEHARVDGDRGFLDGRYAQDARLLAEDRVVHASGRFTGEWIRDAAGAWRIRRLETAPDPSGAR